MSRKNLIDELSLNNYFSNVLFSPTQDIADSNLFNSSEKSQNIDHSIEKPRRENSNHFLDSFDDRFPQELDPNSKLAIHTPIDKVGKVKGSPQTNEVSTRDNTVQKLNLSYPTTHSKKATPSLSGRSQMENTFDLTPPPGKSYSSHEKSSE